MRRLEKKYGKKKGREMAESQYKNFLERHQQEEYEEVQRQQEVLTHALHIQFNGWKYHCHLSVLPETMNL